MEPITTKQRMYDLLLGGRLGNIVRGWASYEELVASGYRGPVSMRSKEVSSPVRKYHVPWEELEATLAALPASHKDAGLIFSESPLDHLRVIQGELCRHTCGLYFTYTFSPLPMRLAFEVQRLEATGLKAKMLLERYLDPRDLDDLYGLLDDFQDHVVEFSTFRIPVGTLRRPTVVWELRLYMGWVSLVALAVTCAGAML